MSASTGLISITERMIRRARRGGRRPRPAQETVTAKTSPFARRWLAAGMLLAAASVIVLYVANAIVVGDLLVDITSLERERDLVRDDNEKLRAELLKLMSVERVTSLAAERLAMKQPGRPPIALTEPAVRPESRTPENEPGERAER